MTTDNAIVNVPLSKRGDIDAQLDAYKRNKAREERQLCKALAQETKRLRERAKAIVSGLPDERIAGVGKLVGMTPTRYRKWLMSEAHWNPNLIIRAYGSGR